MFIRTELNAGLKKLEIADKMKWEAKQSKAARKLRKSASCKMKLWKISGSWIWMHMP